MNAFDKIDEWVRQYREGSLSEEDRVELTEWIEASPENRKEFERMLGVWLRVSAAGKWKGLNVMQENVWRQVRPVSRKRVRRLYSWGTWGAAIAIILIGVVCLWKQMYISVETSVTKGVLTAEFGSAKAILVLNSEKQIELKDGETREVMNIAGVDVVQDSTGGVRFEDSGLGSEEEMNYNTIVVPERGEYFVILSDGTKVWMNSGSELIFPIRFHGDLREVTLKGEACFEVKSDPQKPFYVHINKATIRVLGTVFNVMAYQEDRQTEVALQKGKVCFDVAGESYMLVPGEIATLNQESGETMVRKGDVEAIMDWKTGRFNFEDMALDELTVKLSRWYGVSFVFGDEAAKGLRFSGAVTKYRTLDYVLDMIAVTTDVIFSEKEGKVIVYIKK